MSEIVGTLWVYLIELLWWVFKNFPVILVAWLIWWITIFIRIRRMK